MGRKGQFCFNLGLRPWAKIFYVRDGRDQGRLPAASLVDRSLALLEHPRPIVGTHLLQIPRSSATGPQYKAEACTSTNPIFPLLLTAPGSRLFLRCRQQVEYGEDRPCRLHFVRFNAETFTQFLYYHSCDSHNIMNAVRTTNAHSCSLTWLRAWQLLGTRKRHAMIISSGEVNIKVWVQYSAWAQVAHGGERSGYAEEPGELWRWIRTIPQFVPLHFRAVSRVLFFTKTNNCDRLN